MTAVIGILNKNAVAIAADSAVTVSGNNGRKIYNTANKIFTLSKYNPVSVVIYNSANFLTTPWEIIIKIFRKELDKKSFPKLDDYSQYFFRFLKKRKFFTTEETINHFNQSFILSSFEELRKISIQQALENEEDLISKTENERLIIFRKNILKNIEYHKRLILEEPHLSDFKELTKDKFKDVLLDSIQYVLETEFEEFSTEEITEKFIDLIFTIIKSKNFIGQWSGLVFAGYGENEIYPSVINTKVANVFDNKLRFYTEAVENISDRNNGSIMPFAQRDVIDTLISGISPDINQTLFSTFNKFLKGYNDFVIHTVQNDHPQLAESLKKIDIDNICKQFVDEVDEVKQIKHIVPTVNTVSVLSKEDLAEMAESLIYLTYLKRRISSDEESVGGPVDVAIISKGDGFIWIKRKHYFEEKHNPQFNRNYFNS